MESKQAKHYKLDLVLYCQKLIENNGFLFLAIGFLVTVTVIVLLCINYSKPWHPIVAVLVWLLCIITLFFGIIIYSEKQVHKKPIQDIIL